MEDCTGTTQAHCGGDAHGAVSLLLVHTLVVKLCTRAIGGSRWDREPEREVLLVFVNTLVKIFIEN